MIYLTEKFPPTVDLHLSPNGAFYEYRFHYGKWELAHCMFQLSPDNDILYIENLARSIHYPPYFKKEHLCTELLNSMLFDIFCKWDVIPQRIQGKLAATDSKNGNWKRSIPFYQNFPKYLEKRLPYSLTFSIIDDQGYAIPAEKYENIDQFVDEYEGKELHFLYIVNTNPQSGKTF